MIYFIYTTHVPLFIKLFHTNYSVTVTKDNHSEKWIIHLTREQKALIPLLGNVVGCSKEEACTLRVTLYTRQLCEGFKFWKVWRSCLNLQMYLFAYPGQNSSSSVFFAWLVFCSISMNYFYLAASWRDNLVVQFYGYALGSGCADVHSKERNQLYTDNL